MKLQHQPELGSFRPEGPVSPSRDRSLGTLPQNQLSGTGLPSQGPVASPWGTGLSHQGSVPESKNLRTCPETQISNFLVKIQSTTLHQVWKKLETPNPKHSNLAICESPVYYIHPS
uniref:Uncharacterized protein n=1 Tax=Ananas comosus var. bracteatus TaxID=296719 RepID=A0A6V7P1X3_ANACO|nr:unnamed protein product [Ananas comosus var. bracteatus]